MAGNGPFGFDPDDFDRMAREAGEGLRDMLSKMMQQAGGQGFANLFGDAVTHSRREPETSGEAGSGVWAIVVLEAGGVARVDQVYSTEIDALRAHKDNTDARRRVRFLPYGVSVSILDSDTEDAEVVDDPGPTD
jgi:hypothetical protein